MVGTRIIRVKKVCLKKHEKKRDKMEQIAKNLTGETVKLSWSQYLDIIATQPFYVQDEVVVKKVRRKKR